jgi:serine/threonine protein kinase
MKSEKFVYLTESKKILSDQGGQGSVFTIQMYRKTRPQNVFKCVVKQYPSQSREAAVREIQIYRYIAHKGARYSPYFLQLYDTFEYDGQVFLAMEYFEGKSLEQYIPDLIKYVELVDIFYQCASAVKTLHDIGVLHIDVKPENFMMNSSRQVKIIDFGMSCILMNTGDELRLTEFANEKCKVEMYRGTPIYLAPEIVAAVRKSDQPSTTLSMQDDFEEILEPKDYAFADTYSLGLVFLQFLIHDFLNITFRDVLSPQFDPLKKLTESQKTFSMEIYTSLFLIVRSMIRRKKRIDIQGVVVFLNNIKKSIPANYDKFREP